MIKDNTNSPIASRMPISEVPKNISIRITAPDVKMLTTIENITSPKNFMITILNRSQNVLSCTFCRPGDEIRCLQLSKFIYDVI